LVSRGKKFSEFAAMQLWKEELLVVVAVVVPGLGFRGFRGLGLRD
jgi:hypothetical protein